MATLIEDLACFAAELRMVDVPEGVLELCRAQRRSVLGAIAAAGFDEAVARMSRAVKRWASPGPAPLLVSTVGDPDDSLVYPVPLTVPDRVRVDDALFAACAASMALDFDDYMCFGHTGHSAVLVPLLVACETGSSGKEQLMAQLVANEVAARLGGACLIGPQNGQLWSFIHCVAAAAASGRLLGLGPSAMAHALAISLYQPPFATPPGFFMPDSKLFTAAEPALSGLRAARLAAQGMTGPLDVLDEARGFFSAFATVPLKGALGGIGNGWATSTLSVKPYPGCAYIDTLIDALGRLGWPRFHEVAAVEVEASLLTCVMDRMSARYLPGTGDVSSTGQLAAPPTPVAVTFSVPWSVAVTLIARELTPAQLSSRWLSANLELLGEAAGKVSLRHDPRMTRLAAQSFGAVVPPGLVAKQVGLSGLLRTLPSARELLGRAPSSGNGTRWGRRLLEGFSRLEDLRRTAELGLVRDLIREVRSPGSSHGQGGPPVAGSWWDAEALDGFSMSFPARVKVRYQSGREAVEEVEVPRGAAGNREDSPAKVATEKLSTFGPLLFGEDGTAALDAAIGTDEADLWSRLGSRHYREPTG